MVILRNATFISSILSFPAVSLNFVDLYYHYLAVALLFPLLLFKYRTIDKNLILVLAYVSAMGLINVVLENNDFFSFAKNIAGVSIAYCLFFLIIKDVSFDIILLFRLYYKFAFVLACVGLVQFISSLVGFQPGYQFAWLGLRTYVADPSNPYFFAVHSLTNEPSFFAIILVPSLLVAIKRLFRPDSFSLGTRTQALCIITAFLLSQSSTGYVALLITIILFNLNKITLKRLAIGLIFFPLFVYSLYSFVPKFKDRVDSSIALFGGEVIIAGTQIGKENASSLILFNHFLVAQRNAADHPFGTGVGSHHAAFAHYNDVYAWFTGYGRYSILLNIHDASSLFNRLLSEFGYVGLFVVFIFLFRHFSRNGPEDLVLLNQASFVMICTYLLRDGHYFTFGLPFFVLSFYYTSCFIKVCKASEQSHGVRSTTDKPGPFIPTL